MTSVEYLMSKKITPVIRIVAGSNKAEAFVTMTIRQFEEYGKYCAEQAWKEAIQQHSMLSLSNMVNGGFVMKSPDEWWSEFQRKEAQE